VKAAQRAKDKKKKAAAALADDANNSDDEVKIVEQKDEESKGEVKETREIVHYTTNQAVELVDNNGDVWATTKVSNGEPAYPNAWTEGFIPGAYVELLGGTDMAIAAGWETSLELPREGDPPCVTTSSFNSLPKGKGRNTKKKAGVTPQEMKTCTKFVIDSQYVRPFGGKKKEQAAKKRKAAKAKMVKNAKKRKTTKSDNNGDDDDDDSNNGDDDDNNNASDSNNNGDDDGNEEGEESGGGGGGDNNYNGDDDASS
jgi:sRNA-binding protein